MRCVHGLPLSQLETMTLSYIPLFAMTYFFWWVKPKDVLTPSVVDLRFMPLEQKATFESLAVSSTFDDEGIRKQESLWTVFSLTSRVFEKENKDKELQEAQWKAFYRAEQNFRDKKPVKEASQVREVVVASHGESAHESEKICSANLAEACKPPAKQIVVAYWDPEVYRSKRLWPIICLFGASFGALHLLSWNTVFRTLVEQWLWRAAALVSIFSMLVFMQFEKVIFRWGGPLTILSLVSPALYFLSRIVMIGGVIAAFRVSDPAIYDTYDVSTYWIHIL